MSEANGYATIESVFQPGDSRTYVEVVHPERGRFCLQTITALERSQWEASGQLSAIQDNPAKLRSSLLTMKERLIVLCWVDPENKKKMLTEANVPTLQQQDSAFIDWLFECCHKHCGFSKADIEELVGN